MDRTPKVEMFVSQPTVQAELWRASYEVTGYLYRNGVMTKVFGPANAPDLPAEVDPSGLTTPPATATMG